MIQLPPADYWEMRTRQREVELFLCELKLCATSHWRDDGDVRELLQQRLEAALTQRAAVWAHLETQHEIPPGDYDWDDDTTSLTPKGTRECLTA